MAIWQLNAVEVGERQITESSCVYAQVYKGGEHPHSPQKPSDITSLINIKPGAQ